MAKKRANGEGSICKRSDGHWEGRYTAGYGPKTGKRINTRMCWAGHRWRSGKS